MTPIYPHSTIPRTWLDEVRMLTLRAWFADSKVVHRLATPPISYNLQLVTRCYNVFIDFANVEFSVQLLYRSEGC